MTKAKEKRLILTINRKGGDITVRPLEEKRLLCFFVARSAKQPSFPVAIFLKPEILRMLYTMWLNSCWLFKMMLLKDELTDFVTG